VLKNQKHVGLPMAPFERRCEPQVADPFDEILVNRNRRLAFQVREIEQLDRLLIGSLFDVVSQKVCEQFGVNQESPNEMIVRMGNTGHSVGLQDKNHFS